MQAVILILSGFFLIVVEVKEKILKNIKIVKTNKKNINNIEYYREKLDDYSPLIYAKLLNKDIATSDTIISMILYLEEKNIIDIDEQNNLIVKNNKNLKRHEKFFIEKMKFIFSDLYHHTKTKYSENYTVIEYLERLVYEDMIDDGLIDIKDKKSTLINSIKGKKYINIIDVLPLIYDMVAILILASSADNSSTNFLMNVIFWTTIFVSIFINVVCILSNFKLETLKTEKGHEGTIKMQAQKRFLREYSLISEKAIGDKIIWEYYIRCAILLDLKGKLDDESIKFYRTILDKYKYNGLEIQSNNLLFNVLVSFFVLLPWVLLSIVGNSLFRTVLCAFIVVPVIYSIFINKMKKL